MVEMFGYLASAVPAFLDSLFTINMLAAMLIGVAGGMVIGALPGLNPTTGIALMMPLTYTMSPIPALTMLMGIYTAAITGGSFTAILVHTPGTSSNILTLEDGYPMAARGEPLRALNISLYSSVFGGVISALILIFTSPILAKAALTFDSPEYFLLAVFGVSIIAGLSDDGAAKAFAIGCFGLLVSTVGVAPQAAINRYTFGRVDLMDGLNVTVMVIGTFSISQVMIMSLDAKDPNKNQQERIKLEGKWLLPISDLKVMAWPAIKSTIIGVAVGILPGAGSGIGSYVAYNNVKKSSKHPEEFGKGSVEGLAASESANNAVTGGAMIPMLTLGVPGSPAAALLLGGLMIQGLLPGSTLFTQQANITYSILFGFLLANVVMLPVGIVIARMMGNIVRIPQAILCPVIAALALLGSYCVNQRIIDVFIVLGFGIFGYFVRKAHYATAGFALGRILGNMAEMGLRRSLVMARGEPIAYYLGRPACIVLMILIVGSLFGPPILNLIKKQKTSKD